MFPQPCSAPALIGVPSAAPFTGPSAAHRPARRGVPSALLRAPPHPSSDRPREVRQPPQVGTSSVFSVALRVSPQPPPGALRESLSPARSLPQPASARPRQALPQKPQLDHERIAPQPDPTQPSPGVRRFSLCPPQLSPHSDDPFSLAVRGFPLSPPQSRHEKVPPQLSSVHLTPERPSPTSPASPAQWVV